MQETQVRDEARKHGRRVNRFIPEYCIKFIRKVAVEPRTLFFPQFCGVATLTEIVRLKKKGATNPCKQGR